MAGGQGRRPIVYLAIENRVLRARSEINGFASNNCAGMMEQWSIGIMGLAESAHFFE